MRLNVFSTFVASSTVNATLRSILLKHLVLHHDDFVDNRTKTMLLAAKSMVNTPMGVLFSRLPSSSFEPVFQFLQTQKGVQTGVPEVLTMQHLPLDMLQLAAVDPAMGTVLAQQPLLCDKLVVNVSPFLKSDGQFSNMAGFQNLVVRDVLSRHYFTESKRVWLNPSLIQFPAEMYSLCLSQAVGQWFNLDYKTQSVVALIFAYFFLCLVSDADTAQGLLWSRYRSFMVSDQTLVKQMLGLVEEALGKAAPETLDDVLLVIAQLDQERLVLNKAALFSKIKTLGPDTYTSLLALEYPPAFLFLMMLVASGAKITLQYRIKNINSLQKLNSFIDSLVNSSILID